MASETTQIQKYAKCMHTETKRGFEVLGTANNNVDA